MAKHIESVRNTILSTARRLILAQGYRKTTIRQIVQASGIASGSIYHLFPNKDKIFWALVQELLERTTRIVTEDFAHESPAFRYVAILEVELTAIAESPAVQEIYYESYARPETFGQIVERAAALQRGMLPPSAETAADDEAQRMQALLFKGAMYGYIMSFSFEREIDPAQSRMALVEMALQSIGMDEQAGAELAERMETMQPHWRKISQAVLDEDAAGAPQEGRSST